MGQDSQFRRLAGASKKKPSPPIMSSEFIIQNHGDIMSCLLMIIFAGFMFQVTSPLAGLFVLPQYNVTSPDSPPMLYTNGRKDILTLLCYTIGWVTLHAVIQEYILDRLQRRLHLSKTKTSKFTESGQLLFFSFYSAIHAGYMLHQDGFAHDIARLWTDYPEQHRQLTLYAKMFFLIQIAYWLHQFPEFFFQRIKRDEIKVRSIYSFIYLVFIAAAYTFKCLIVHFNGLLSVFSFNRVAMAILFLHYIAEFIFHASRMAYFADNFSISRPGFKLWNSMFVLVRLGCVTLAVLTFWYGLRTNETPFVDSMTGNYNTTFIRLNSLLCVLGVQVWMMWNFTMFHLRRFRESSRSHPRQVQQQQQQQHQQRKQRKAAKKLENEVRNLPEADQESNMRVLRSAKKQK